MADEHADRDRIRRWHKDADDLLAAISAELNAQQLPDSDAARAVVARVQQSALDVKRAAEEPVTLGMVGEFSVGKSLLLGTLLGKPNLLPVDDRAVTGNVTALYLSKGQPNEPTKTKGTPEVQYLTIAELSDCVKTILAELVRNMDAVLQYQPAELKDYDPIEQGWDRLVRACKPLFGPNSSRNPIILQIAEELLAIRAAHLSGNALLGAEVPVDDDKVSAAAVDLGATGTLSYEYPELPVKTGLNRADVQRDPAALRITFPLIRRVTYRVLVNPAVWPFDKLADNDDDIVLLDFPGLTANRSGKRDEYLSAKELANVHTIVTVFSMRKPDNDTPHKFRSMLEMHGRDRAELDESILAVGNMFDIVPGALEGSGPLTFEDVQSKTDKIKRFTNTARDLVGKKDAKTNQDDRIVMVSPVVGIWHYGYPVTAEGEEAERLASAIREAPDSAQAWAAVASRLAAGERGSHWTSVLTEYGRDGGIAALRALIVDHAAKHGLVNKIKGVERKNRALRDQLPQLERMLTADRSSSAETELARQALSELFDQFRDQHKRLVNAAGEFRDPLRLMSADNEPLISATRDSTVTAVFKWPHWQAIMLRADHGFIPKNKKGQSESLAEELFGKLESTTADETTATFLPSYVETFRTTSKEGRKQLAEAVTAWADKHQADLADLRDRMADPDVRHYLETGFARLAGQANRIGALTALTDLYRLLQISEDKPEPSLLSRACPDGITQAEEVDEEEIKKTYPLHLVTDMPWHSAVPAEPGDREQELARHQVYLFRVRRQLASGLADAVSARLTGQAVQFYTVLRKLLEDMRGFIPDLVELRRMFPPDQKQGSEEPPPEGTVSPLRQLLREWARRNADAA